MEGIVGEMVQGIVKSEVVEEMVNKWWKEQ